MTEDLSAAITNPPMNHTLSESFAPSNDLISMGPPGWSPDIAPMTQMKAQSNGKTENGLPEIPKQPPNAGTGGGGDGLAVTELSNKAMNDPPEYPAEARRNRWQGTVKLQMRITIDGRVEEVKVLQTSGYALLDAAAVEKVSTYHVTPFAENGQPVEADVTLPICFQLRDRRK